MGSMIHLDEGEATIPGPLFECATIPDTTHCSLCHFYFLGWEMKKTDQARAPIYEALQRFREMRVVPFDVPGHKHGRGNPELAAFLGEQCISIDVNSMKPLDNLCHPVSVIKQAELLAADAFGAAYAFFMVGGTTVRFKAKGAGCESDLRKPGCRCGTGEQPNILRNLFRHARHSENDS